MNLGGTVRLNKFGLFVLISVVILLFYYMNRNNVSQPRSVNLRHLLFVSIEIAERGGSEIVKVKSEHNVKEMSKGKTKEGANVPVTTADFKSHCAMYYPVVDLFPDITVISEERDPDNCAQTLPIELVSKGLPNLEDVDVLMKDVVIWIDPLDATQEFTEDMDEYVTTMVCVAHKNIPVIGVIHRPFAKQHKTFWAWKNKGHSPLQSPLETKGKESEGSETVILSRSHAGHGEEVVKKALGENTRIIKAGGSGYKVLQLIGGNATIYTHITNIHKWDICAGDAIVTALGGRFSTLEDEDIYYGDYSSDTNTHGIVATMAQLQDRHMEISHKLFAAFKH